MSGVDERVIDRAVEASFGGPIPPRTRGGVRSVVEAAAPIIFDAGKEEARKEHEARIEAEAVDRETRADEIEVFYPAKSKTLRRHAEVIRSLLSGPMKKGGE